MIGHRLGFNDLNLETVDLDSRLTYTYTNSDKRGQEPYVVINIPNSSTEGRITSDLFTYNFI